MGGWVGGGGATEVKWDSELQETGERGGESA